MIGVNPIGKDPSLEYNGGSAVFDPLGNEVVRIENEEGLTAVEIDVPVVEETRERMPFLKDMKLI